MEHVVVGEDRVSRCRWAVSTPEYVEYHDREWGRPVSDETRIFEKLCLEGFQSGLSWLTILRKREGFRRAFDGFSPTVVANFGEQDVERLLNDASIIRHQGKITAAIGNAKATLGLHDSGQSLAGLFWSYEPKADAGSGPAQPSDVPPLTDESTALSTSLRRAGFRFVGPTTVYAAMQALGVVNDHFDGCDLRAAAEAERARFVRPPPRGA